ncbi:hypothetical protein ES332_D10G236800v1 [Gossypium tomentosum]|uniref:non-specific serine/threonine protein kinase n=1 Tax=Gossypium tomentosum TaxID=34277 RepID=A0A5D2J9F8_GOSTO|nr:hypothetical protein ES332_D10G236800v1 [Gossypium tomentosum]
MAPALTSVHFWLFSCLLAVISMAEAQEAEEFIYNQGFRDAKLQLDGSANICSNGLLQLTNNIKRLKGHAFYPSPINFNVSSSSSSAGSLSFSTNFVIAIVPGSKESSGHGLAFVISKSTDFSHAEAVEFLGLVNESNNGNSFNHFFAVEFDTILSLDMGDIDDNHVGIDLNGVKSNKSVRAGYFSNEERKNRTLDLNNGHPIQVWIDYKGEEELLNITLAPDKTPKPDQPLLSTSIDLSGILKDVMYVGFPAATGSIQSASSSHYILGWSFNRGGEAQGLDISKLPKLPKNGGQRNTVRLISIIAAVALLLIIIGAAYVYRMTKYKEVHEDWEKEYGPQRFSYKTLYKATKGFKDKQLLGSGGFGKVYKGTLPYSNEQIAVKKVSHETNQGMKEFVSEIVSMGRLRHKNLVRLLGYCRRKKELILVYDLMENGSLDKFLFDNDKPTLTWFQRFQIIKGVASALLYLHEEWEQVVLHRDVKASNVLLDFNLNGRLGDFGLARLYDRDGDPQTTRLVGTLGYIDPELIRMGRATKAADVFAFGVLLLEVAYAIVDVIDPRLQGNYVVEEIEKVLKLGLLCSNPKPDLRPTIKEAVSYLEGTASLPDIPLDNAQNNPSSILQTIPLSPHSTAINVSLASNVASDCIVSFSSSVGTGLSVNSLSSTDTVLHIGR